MTRTEQLKQIFAQAVDMTIEKNAYAFEEDVNVELLKRRLRADMNKFEIVQELELFGVLNARDIAQIILRNAFALDK